MSGANGTGHKPRLELTWIGKDERPRLEPRILLPVPEQSHAKGKRGDGGIHDNMLIHGDNLLALKALENEFSGKVKCAFIDPPYNTGSAFGSFYDDGIEHSTWLSLLRSRIELIWRLLALDGTLWVSIDDYECHYLKVMMDEVFGRQNFVSNVVWQKKYAPSNDALWLSDTHDHILCYAKDKATWRPYPLPRTEEQDALYIDDGDERGPWMSDNYTCAKSADERPNLYYPIKNPNTDEDIWPKRTRVWGFDRATHDRHVGENRIYWGRNGTNSTPRLKKFLSELRRPGRVPSTIWHYEEVGHNQDAKREAVVLNPNDPFPTPKPEKLLFRVLQIASRAGDIVLDSFAGSGTTGAVAHKMGRRWIMVELGEHATTHIVPRLKKVIDGQDPGGVTEAVGWKAGGGYRMFRLAPSLIEEDQFGQKIISKQYNAAMLSEAMCKHMGYTYAPSPDAALYWKQGYATERDFIFTTTQSLTHDGLKALSLEVGTNRTLLVCCKAFRARLGDFQNLTVKKIPQAVLENCEWGRDDYSLNIAEPSQDAAAGADDEPGDGDDGGNSGEPAARSRRRAADIDPAGEAHTAAVKKAPLKMDGTTRAPRAIKAQATSTAPVPEPAKAAAAAPVAPSKPKATKPREVVAAKRVKPSGSDASPKGSKPAAKKDNAVPTTKPRRAGDNMQGMLL